MDIGGYCGRYATIALYGVIHWWWIEGPWFTIWAHVPPCLASVNRPDPCKYTISIQECRLSPMSCNAKRHQYTMTDNTMMPNCISTHWWMTHVQNLFTNVYSIWTWFSIAQSVCQQWAFSWRFDSREPGFKPWFHQRETTCLLSIPYTSLLSLHQT